ncbi:recombinase family protein [Amycolatopsis sp. cmx-8-4]|uniref:recombinase family protein n=1 Tax=Amycolatopsis sp. cmx-8-4 TaxID=2790947 RepID=UPI0039782E39
MRVSTKEQARTGGGAEGYSIPAQRAACLVKAEQLGAVVHEEYVDAGESARSADRDDLQRMLQDVRTLRPDYVIVHKIDRLARNREDDIAINLALKKHGAQLVSCTENIDDTPSGRLLYGLMAEIAQFYSGNLALEVMKGSLRKAEEGGTPFRAPTGYINVRQPINGVLAATVILDPERADLVRWCLEQYATGEWTVSDLTLTAQAKGLTARPTPKRAAQPISLNGMHSLLRNPYYMGVVAYQGIHYEGKHQPLIEPETWLAIQDTLSSHNHVGDRDYKHNHYLRGTIYCSDCGGRLVYSENTGRGGTYAYYICVKKKTKQNNCHRPGMRLERIEEGMDAFYQRFRISPELSAHIQAAVRQELAQQEQDANKHLKHAQRLKDTVQDERQKLLQAHYAGAVPQDLLVTEMQRLTRQLAQADREIQSAKATTADIEQTLAEALMAAERCPAAYLTAPDNIRRQINQGFFKKLYIDEDGGVVGRDLTEPFATLLDGVTASAATDDHPVENPSQMTADETDRRRPSHVFRATFDDVTDGLGGGNEDTPAWKMIFSVRGVNKHDLVGAAGFEPATARV